MDRVGQLDRLGDAVVIAWRSRTIAYQERGSLEE
jgi:hypothetical protein